MGPYGPGQGPQSERNHFATLHFVSGYSNHSEGVYNSCPFGKKIIIVYQKWENLEIII